MGLAQPVIILPDALLREGNTELLTSAIGHEFIHVTRNDYVLNFIYELLYLPLSFHPAAALLGGGSNKLASSLVTNWWRLES
jgi:beta-lactamase regulating signal transducer with metallopeptidase domain